VRLVRRRLEVGRPGDQAERAIARVGGDLALGDALLERLADALEAAVDERLLEVEERHPEARGGRDLRDPVTHGSGAEDERGARASARWTRARPLAGAFAAADAKSAAAGPGLPASRSERPRSKADGASAASRRRSTRTRPPRM